MIYSTFVKEKNYKIYWDTYLEVEAFIYYIKYIISFNFFINMFKKNSNKHITKRLKVSKDLLDIG